MLNTPLTDFLDHLEHEEWQDLAVFLRSPMATVTPLGLKLFEILLTNRSQWLPGQPDREDFLHRHQLFALLYPGQPFKDQRFRRVVMELLTALKSFFAWQSHQNVHWLVTELAYLRQLLDRRLYHRFPKAFRQVERRLEAQTDSHPKLQLYLIDLYRLENEYLIHSREEEDSFERVGTALDRFYLSNKLENWASMLTREKRYPQRHLLAFQPELLAMLNVAPLDQWPEVRIWQLVHALESSNASPGDYLALGYTLKENPGLLPLGKLRQVRGYMFNFLNRRIRTDRVEDYRQCWELLKTMLEEGTLHLSGRLSEPFMRVAIRSACFAGEVDWAAQFLDHYANDLVGPERGQVLAVLRIHVLLYQGDYGKVLRKINTLRSANPRFEILLRISQLKALFALQDDEVFFRHAESFLKLLGRKKGLSDRIRAAHRAFVQLAMLKAKVLFYGDSTGDLKERINASDASEKLWLLEGLE